MPPTTKPHIPTIADSYTKGKNPHSSSSFFPSPSPPSKMQSIFNLHGSCGLPLCLSGITHPLTFSKEMADHDRRREALKKQIVQARGVLHENHDMGITRSHERDLEEIREGEVHRPWDLAAIVHDLSYMCLACSAKAA